MFKKAGNLFFFSFVLSSLRWGSPNIARRMRQSCWKLIEPTEIKNRQIIQIYLIAAQWSFNRNINSHSLYNGPDNNQFRCNNIILCSGIWTQTERYIKLMSVCGVRIRVYKFEFVFVHLPCERLSLSSLLSFKAEASSAAIRCLATWSCHRRCRNTHQRWMRKMRYR